MSCPLCHSQSQQPFHQDKWRAYLRCDQCHLIHVPPRDYLSPQAEKAEYDLHENSPDDAGYRRFLGRVFNPLAERLPPNSVGLDFGCGPGPTLSVMFEEIGHTVALYDPFYARNPAIFEQTFDFITATEVVEHFHAPHQEFDRLWTMLRPTGTLGIMTKLAHDRDTLAHDTLARDTFSRDTFSTWHYKADRTHVCFYSRHTFQWLAQTLAATVTFIGNDVILLHKS